MKTVRFSLRGVSPISFSRPIQSKKGTGESADDFENRVWKEHLHVMPDGEVFIPGPAIKNCLSDCARFLSETVPGKGKATYTKHFEAGILAFEPVLTGHKAESVQGERLFLASDGKKNSGKRVWKVYPFLPAGWECSGELILLDPLLIGKPEKVEEYFKHAGKFIGLGRFRPRNGGYYGRFEVTGFSVA